MRFHFTRFLCLSVSLAVLAGCATPVTPLPTPFVFPTPAVPTVTAPVVAPPSTVTPPAASIPSPAATSANSSAVTAAAPAPTTAPAPTQASIPTLPATQAGNSTGTSGGLLKGYQDDRSTAVSVLQSLFNAVNRREYVRAYSYWESPGQSTQPGVPQSYTQFQLGYQNTASVQIVTGPVGSEAGAGQIYYSVPVALKAQTTGGQTQVFSGCYILHLARPEIQDAPPYHPLAIFSAQISSQSASANLGNLAAGGCDALGTRQIVAPTPGANPNDLSANNYLDDRSDPVLVLRSLFNAINSRQYDRAYSYWQNPSSGNVPPYDQFKQGYQNTASIEVTFGSVTSNGAAGNFYFTVPVTLQVKTTSGGTQTFVGCYLEHMADPGVYGAPPYTPLGIQKAQVQQVTSTANLSSLLNQACNNMP